jgi:glutathione S-transferase
MPETLEIYGSYLSQPARSVLIYCKLSGIPYKFHVVEFLNREHLTDEYKKINPYRKVPAIVHGDYKLWESAAIVTYLADAYDADNQWYPKDIKVRGRINSYLHWHHEAIRRPLIQYIRSKLILPLFGFPELTPEKEAILKKNSETVLKKLSNILNNFDYVARTQYPTVADVFAYSEIASGLLINLNLSFYPIVKNWFDNIGKIKEVKEVHAVVLNSVSSVPAKEKL